MPRGKAVFKTTSSPHSDDWPEEPEEALREIARRNNAKYIDGSLVFVPNGDLAEALFETVEPERDSGATLLHQLGVELDAINVSLFFDKASWKRQQGVDGAEA